MGRAERPFWPRLAPSSPRFSRTRWPTSTRRTDRRRLSARNLHRRERISRWKSKSSNNRTTRSRHRRIRNRYRRRKSRLKRLKRRRSPTRSTRLLIFCQKLRYVMRAHIDSFAFTIGAYTHLSQLSMPRRTFHGPTLNASSARTHANRASSAAGVLRIVTSPRFDSVSQPTFSFSSTLLTDRTFYPTARDRKERN